MLLISWIPGAAHWIHGQKGKSVFLLALFASLAGVGIWRAGRIGSAIGRVFTRASDDAPVFNEGHWDALFASIFLIGALAALLVYNRLSARRLARRKDQAEPDAIQGQWVIAWRQFKKSRLALAGSILILALYLIAILCPLISPYDPTSQGHRVRERLLHPSSEHLLGTDKFSRDVFSRILYGSRVSLFVGILAVSISITIGTIYGALSGCLGRWADSILMRFVDMMLAFPTLILIITIIALWRNQSIWIVIAVIGLTSWMGVARLVRGEILLIKELDYFQAARALGAGTGRLIFRHLLPNALTPIIIAATLRVGSTILVEASLSYLALGVQPPHPSWGNIVNDSRGYLFTEWWIPLSAGLAIVVTVMGYNLLGDGLRDALDPKLRR